MKQERFRSPEGQAVALDADQVQCITEGPTAGITTVTFSGGYTIDLAGDFGTIADRIFGNS